MKNTHQANHIASPIVAVTVTVEPSLPQAPDWLGTVAKVEYDRVRCEIHLAGPEAINRTDPGMLVRYAQAWGEVVRLTLAVREEGEVVTGSDGVPRLSENCLALNRAHRELFLVCERLGFSPKDRARLNGSERRDVEGFQ